MQIANGKAIVLGEHFVVHGAQALAIAIEPGATVVSEPCDQPVLRVPEWGFSTENEPDSRLSQAFASLTDAITEKIGAARPRLMDVTCHLPAGAGLGSSAAIGVALARELLVHRGVDAYDDELVHELVFAWERTFHGTPSGLDHAVAMTSGGLRYDPLGQTRFHVLRPKEPLHFVVCVPQPGADTGEMVARVRQVRDTDPHRFSRLLEDYGEILEQGVRAFRTGDVHRLGACMNRNHLLLREVRVSTDVLDDCIETLRMWGALGAKLTGAGGGGAVLAIAPSAPAAEELMARCESNQLTCLLVSIGT